LNSVIRKAIKSRKIIYLAIMSASRRWIIPLQKWKLAMNKFSIEVEGISCIVKIAVRQDYLQALSLTN